MPLFERPQEPWPESQREREDRLIAKLVRMEHEARRHASDDTWDVQPQPKDVPYPFIFEPNSGWLNWGTQGGVHDEIVNNLYRTGERVPNGSFFGRWYPHSDHVEFYDPQYFELPYRQQQQHQETVLRNAPGRPQKASGGDAWNEFGLGDQDDWKVASATGAMYHVAPISARDAIQTNGLNPGHRTYVWASSDDAHNFGMRELKQPYDVWQVSTDGLKLQRDPNYSPLRREEDVENEEWPEDGDADWMMEDALFTPPGYEEHPYYDYAYYTDDPVDPERIAHLDVGWPS